MAEFEFSGEAKTVTRPDGEKFVAVWTDGVSLSSDGKIPCAYMLQPGARYKITVEPANTVWDD